MYPSKPLPITPPKPNSVPRALQSTTVTLEDKTNVSGDQCTTSPKPPPDPGTTPVQPRSPAKSTVVPDTSPAVPPSTKKIPLALPRLRDHNNKGLLE